MRCSIQRALRAFTLIEMLTVIAIIGILAGILIPAVVTVRSRTRNTTATHDIKALEQAIQVYNLDFGAYPPDTNQGLSANGVDFSGMDNPNECLVWFLTRSYAKDPTLPSTPWSGGTGWDPKTSPGVFARISGGPYFDVKAKQRRDLGPLPKDGFYEFVDPWGRPYMYRAYAPWRTATIAATANSGRDITFTLAGASNLQGPVGKIELRGFSASGINGIQVCTGTASNQVLVSYTTAPAGAAVGATGQYRFPLNNAQNVDLYSLGPNGRTRFVSRPTTGEWGPHAGTEIVKWAEVWGTSADGNDVLGDGGNSVANEKDRDDVNNW